MCLCAGIFVLFLRLLISSIVCIYLLFFLIFLYSALCMRSFMTVGLLILHSALCMKSCMTVCLLILHTQCIVHEILHDSMYEIFHDSMSVNLQRDCWIDPNVQMVKKNAVMRHYKTCANCQGKLAVSPVCECTKLILLVWKAIAHSSEAAAAARLPALPF